MIIKLECFSFEVFVIVPIGLLYCQAVVFYHMEYLPTVATQQQSFVLVFNSKVQNLQQIFYCFFCLRVHLGGEYEFILG